MPAAHVIHTVGPQGENPSLLASCYKRSLEIAEENQIRSLVCTSTIFFHLIKIMKLEEKERKKKIMRKNNHE